MRSFQIANHMCMPYKVKRIDPTGFLFFLAVMEYKMIHFVPIRITFSTI